MNRITTICTAPRAATPSKLTPARIALTITLAAMIPATLAGCAAGAASDSLDATPEPGSVVHSVSPADRAAARSPDPIAADSAMLWINGMGCPQCVTNIDLQLERQFGAKDIRVDLAEGTVRASFPTKRPSPLELARATKDAGLTLVRVASPAR